MSHTSSTLPFSIRIPTNPHPNFFPLKYKKGTKHRSKLHENEAWSGHGKHDVQKTNIATNSYTYSSKGKLQNSSPILHNPGNYYNPNKYSSNKYNILPHHHSPNDPNSSEKKKLDVRKGLFPAEELADYNAKDYPFMDAQCIIRFPFHVAELLRNRLENKQPLGLIIYPTNLHDYRFFEIKVEGIDDQLEGILLELPNLIESYKTLDGDLMFKSADISQIIMVYSTHSTDALNIPLIKEMYNWEWKSGLTPSTRNIRRRKFKNFNVFDKHQIRSAELEVIELLNGLSRDSYEYLAHTEYDMIENSEKFQLSESNERVITTNDDLQKYLETGYASDASDEFFGLPHIPWTPQEPVRQPGTRLGRPRRPTSIHATTPGYTHSTHTYISEQGGNGFYQKYHTNSSIKALSKYERKLLKEKKKAEKKQKSKLIKSKEKIKKSKIQNNPPYFE